jgi:hypothetical protein
MRALLGSLLLCLAHSVTANAGQPQPTAADAARCLKIESLPEKEYTSVEPYCVSRSANGNVCFDRTISIEVRNTCSLSFKLEAHKGGKTEKRGIGPNGTEKFGCLRLETPCGGISVSVIFDSDEPGATKSVPGNPAPPVKLARSRRKIWRGASRRKKEKCGFRRAIQRPARTDALRCGDGG